MFNFTGKNQTMFQFAATEDEGSTEEEYVRAAQGWFESLWNTVGREFSA